MKKFSILIVFLLLVSMCSGQANTWTLVPTTPPTAKNINFFTVDAKNRWFIVDFLLGNFMSLDQGATWTNIGSVNPADWTINTNPVNDDLIIGTIGPSGPDATPNPTAAYFKSSNLGATWTKVVTPWTVNQILVYGCAFAANNAMNCGGRWSPFPGTATWWSTDNAVTTHAGIVNTPTDGSGCNNSGGSAYSIWLNPVDHSLWHGSEQCGAYRSADNGITWTQVTPADQTLDPTNNFRCGNLLSFTNDNAGNTFFASQGGLFRSSGTGPFTWASIINNNNTAAGKVLGRDGAGNLYYTHQPDSTDQVIVHRSTAQGIAGSWSAYDSGLPASGYPGVAGNTVKQYFYNPHDGRMYIVVQQFGGVNTGNKTPPGQLYVLGGAATINPPSAPTGFSVTKVGL
jgi:hypothetical protein